MKNMNTDVRVRVKFQYTTYPRESKYLMEISQVKLAFLRRITKQPLSLFFLFFVFFRSGWEDFYPSDAQLDSAVSTKFRAVFTIPIIIYLKGRPDHSSLLIRLVNLSSACKFHLCQLLISRPLSKLCCLDSHFNGCRTLTQYNWWTSLHGAYTSERTQAGEADDRGSH